MRRLLFLAFIAGLVCTGAADAATRIKDITSVQGVRDNQLIGYGLVIGLAGTGDTMRNAPFTEQSMKAMLDHMGVNVQAGSLRIRWRRLLASPSRALYRHRAASREPRT